MRNLIERVEAAKPASTLFLLIDFNFASNPYCAYINPWSCPFPPADNRLKVRIEAGAKFHE